MTIATATPQKPVAAPVEAENIPAELRAIPRWVGWKWMLNDSGDKWTKPPVDVRNGYQCSKTDPEHWYPFDQALAAHLAGKFDGIGFCFVEADDLAGIDLDDCLDPDTGTLTADASYIIGAVNSYTEVSPSGCGVKIYFRGKLPQNKGSSGDGFEAYQDAAYFCVTGRQLDDTPGEVRVCKNIKDVFAYMTGDDEDQDHYQERDHYPEISDRDLALDALGGLSASRAVGYHDWLRVGMALHATDANLLSEWDRWSQRCGEKYQPDACAAKWKSFGAGSKVCGLGSLIHWAKEDGWVPPWKRNGRHPKKRGGPARKDNRHGLPRIDAGLQDLAAVTSQAWEALHKANGPARLFRHGARLVRIERGDDGEPVLRELTVDRVRHELARAAEWLAVREGKDGPAERSAKPPIDVAKDLLATPDPELPRLVRVVEAPVLGADGSLLLEPGYHPGSATYYSPAGLEVPPVSESPLGDEISEAVDLLTFELLGDFPFVGDSERAHAVALLLLPFCRDLIGGATPLHLIEAPTEGTGKGLLVDVLTIPALGRPVAAMTEGRDEDEWRKRLTSKLRNGPAFVLIDNLKRKLDSAAVSAAITANSWEDRIMGVSEMARMPVRCAWVATGNNPALSAEITRRCIRIRLDAKSPEPWLGRKFRHENLGGWSLENRRRLVWAALTMIRAWITAGRPCGDNPRLGRCEAWSDAMGGILALARVSGFLANIQDFYAMANADAALHKALVGAWWETHGTCKVGTSELWELVHSEEIELDLGGGSDKSQRTTLGKMIGSMRDRAYIIDTKDGAQETVRIVDAGKFRRASQYQLIRVNV